VGREEIRIQSSWHTTNRGSSHGNSIVEIVDYCWADALNLWQVVENINLETDEPEMTQMSSEIRE
jgi:hypothetical protein